MKMLKILFILFIVLNKISTFLFNTNDILNIILLSRPYLTRHTQYDVDELFSNPAGCLAVI